MSKRSKRRSRHLAPFPCVACGECCSRMSALAPADFLAEAGLEMDADGACTQLDGKRCGIYETRPNVCRVEYVGKQLVAMGAYATWDEYHAATAAKCNEWIAEGGGEELVQIGRS